MIKKGYRYSEETLKHFRKSPLLDDIENVKKLYSTGLTAQEIANKYGTPKETVITIFRRIGFKMRRGGKRKGILAWNKGKPYYAIRGDKNPNWKGGITPLNQQIRHCIEYKNWIRKIFKRDNWTCVKCNNRGGNLEADHIKLFSQIIEDNKITSLEEAKNCSELWDISNGQTLCMKCHKRGNIRPVRSRIKRVSNKM